MGRGLLPWVVAGALPWTAPPVAAQGRAATVSFVEGTAQVRRATDVPRDLRQGSSLQQGDVVETGDDSRVELKLPDASVLRVDERARLALVEARFERGAVFARRQLSVKLFSGKVWAKAIPAAGGDRTFRIETDNAMVGARGATFRVDAHPDRSVLLRVYSGAVAVRRNAARRVSPESGGRRAQSRPEEVAREAWEKPVGPQMQMLISADGTPGIPAPFTEADEKDDRWSAWNRERDEPAK